MGLSGLACYKALINPSQNMIKQSFLRNYNLARIHAQAEDQKKKLEVFYSRQVERIIRQRRHMDGEMSKQIKCKQHQAERLRLKQSIQEMKENRNSEGNSTFRRVRTDGTNEGGDQPAFYEDKKKVQLYIADLQLKSSLLSQGSNYQTLKITTVPNRNFHKKMLHSIVSKLKEQDRFHQEQHGRHPSPLQRLKKMKSKTDPSFHDKLQNFNLDTSQLNKSTTARILTKIRMKRTKTYRMMVKRGSLETGTKTDVLRSPRYNAKFVSQLNSKGIINERSQMNVI